MVWKARAMQDAACRKNGRSSYRELRQGIKHTTLRLQTKMKAIWNGKVIAESDETVVVEGNHYFPEDSLKTGNFEPSTTTTVCGWKGTANYYNIVVNGEKTAMRLGIMLIQSPKLKTLRGTCRLLERR